MATNLMIDGIMNHKLRLLNCTYISATLLTPSSVRVAYKFNAMTYSFDAPINPLVKNQPALLADCLVQAVELRLKIVTPVEDVKYLTAQVVKDADPTALPKLASIIQSWFPNLQKLIALKQALPEDKFSQMINLAAQTIIEYKTYNGPAWQCCKCSTINIRDKPLCYSCGEDVSEHVSTGMVPFGGTTIPKFGDVKLDVKPMPPRVKKSKPAPRPRGPAPTAPKQEATVAKVAHVENALMNEQQEMTKLREEVKRLKAERNTAKLNAENKSSQKGILRGLVHKDPRVRAIARSQVTCENPTRFAGEFDDDPSALCNPQDEVVLSFTPDAAVSPPVPASDHFVFQFRNPSRAYVAQEWDKDNKGWLYNIYGRPVRPGGVASEQPAIAWVEHFDNNDQASDYLWLIYGLADTTVEKTSPHGEMILAASTKQDPKSRAFPMMQDNEMNISSSIVTSSAFGTVALELWQWQDNRFVFINEDPFEISAAGTFAKTFNLISPGLGNYAFKLRVNGTSDLTTTVVNIATCQISSGGQQLTFGHHMATGLLDNLNQCSLPIYQAAKWRITNTAEVLSKGGSIQQAHMTGDKHFMSFISSGGVAAAFKNIQQQELEPGATGCYGWLKQHEGCYNQLDYYKTHRVYGIIDSYYPLENEFPFVMIGASYKTEASRSFTMKFQCIIQYTTNDTWRRTALPSTTHMEWMEAKGALKKVRQFYKNDDHIKKINSALGTVKDVADVASSLGELFL